MKTSLTAFILLAAQAIAAPPQGYENGATLRVFQVGHDMSALMPLVPDQTPNVDRLVSTIDFDSAEAFGGPFDRFICELIGAVQIEKPGLYEFALSSDDGSRLTIDDQTLIENDGLHAIVRKTGSLNLTAGIHPFQIDFFENTGGEALRLEWRTPGASQWEVVPEHALLTRSGVTRVVSPGNKRVLGEAGVMKPGYGMPLESVHPAFSVTTIRPEDFEPQVGALALGPDESLYIGTFKPNQNGWHDGLRKVPDGVIWKIDNPRAERSAIQVHRVAEGFFEPAGMVWMDGDLYVSQRKEITRLNDRDGDGFFETHTTVGKGWIADNYHHFTFGLVAKDHLLYATLSTAIALDSDEIRKFGYRGLNGPNPPYRGTLVQVNPRTNSVKYLAGGFRTPNGIGLGPDGQIMVSDNQGAWNPCNSLYAVEEGHFYGHRNTTLPGVLYPDGGNPGPFDDQVLTPPTVALPQSEISNSPTVPATIPNGPFAGQMYLGELTGGGIRRIYLEQVAGVTQGAVFRFTQGLECGVNRLVVDEDGTMFIGGTGAGGNWNWRGTTFGLQRIDPVAEAQWPFEIHHIHAIPGGFRVTFTDPVDIQRLADPDSYTLRQWYYLPTASYGGVKREEQKLAVTQAQPSDDGLSVELLIPELRPGRVVHFAFDLSDRRGRSLWSNEAWYTLNAMPDAAGKQAFGMRVLIFSRTTGFRHASIEDGIAAIRKLGGQYGFDVQATEDPDVFNHDNLPTYDAVVFLNTTGDVLNDEQQAAFERYIRHGGGFVGVHSATDTEYDWPWYGQLVGAWFAGHPAIQPAVIDIVDRTHPATKGLPERWSRRDEWYNFKAQPKGVHVLANLDVRSYKGSTMDPHPIMWCHEFEGGRAFYTESGHTKASYREVEFLRHLAGGIYWAAGRTLPQKPADVQPAQP